MGYKVLNILKSAIFIILFILSIGFLTWGKFYKSVLHYSEPFYQSPTVTICFRHLSSLNGTKLMLGTKEKLSQRVPFHGEKERSSWTVDCVSGICCLQRCQPYKIPPIFEFSLAWLAGDVFVLFIIIIHNNKNSKSTNFDILEKI